MSSHLHIFLFYRKFFSKMAFLKRYWFYILAALITLVGLITGWYFFFLFVLPIGLFNFRNKDRDN